MNSVDTILKWQRDIVEFVRDNFGAEPDAWQIDALNAARDGQRLAMKACKGPGKAQPKDLLIYTPKGLTRFGDLKKGDLVFAEDGSATKVKNVYDRGFKKTYKVIFDDGSFTECCGEHLWKVRGRTEKRKNTWSVISLDEIIARGINKNNYRQFQIPIQGAANFTEKNLRLDPYFLGVWLGDGTRKTGNYSSVDNEIEKLINSKGYDTKKRIQKNRCPVITVYGIISSLKELGISDKYSYEKSIPNDYKFSSIEQRINLLRGLMDTDGTIDKIDSHCEFGTTSFNLANDVIYLVRSLGGKAKFKKTKKTTHKDCYRVTVTTPFNPFCLKRKSSLWKKPTQDRYLARTIVDVHEIGIKDVSCIEVEHNSHCYLTNDFIVTHNTTVLSWIAWWFLATKPHPKIAATSISWDNLADGLWAEMSKWQQKSGYLKSMFTWTKTRIFCNQAPETWFMSARSWSKSASDDQQANTLAGLHADYIMFIIDESGGVPSSVMAAAEAALANDMGEGKEAKLIQAGNPTHLSGPLYDATTRDRKNWAVIEISSAPDDPKRTPRVSKEWAQKQIDTYGADNPWVLVNVYGQFPPSSSNSLLGYEEIMAAMSRKIDKEDYAFSQKRLGIDVARFGDDSTVIFPRQGLQAFKWITMRNARTTDIAQRVSIAKQKWSSEVEYVDGTGGYGAGVIDSLMIKGYSPQEINFSAKATDARFYNKRAEIWWRMAEWIKRGGSIPKDDQLLKELMAPQYYFKGGKIIIQDKDQIKADLGFSPDIADALALTFSDIELHTGLGELGALNKIEQQVQSDMSRKSADYDPLDRSRF